MGIDLGIVSQDPQEVISPHPARAPGHCVGHGVGESVRYPQFLNPPNTGGAATHTGHGTRVRKTNLHAWAV